MSSDQISHKCNVWTLTQQCITFGSVEILHVGWLALFTNSHCAFCKQTQANLQSAREQIAFSIEWHSVVQKNVASEKTHGPNKHVGCSSIKYIWAVVCVSQRQISNAVRAVSNSMLFLFASLCVAPSRSRVWCVYKRVSENKQSWTKTWLIFCLLLLSFAVRSFMFVSPLLSTGFWCEQRPNAIHRLAAIAQLLAIHSRETVLFSHSVCVVCSSKRLNSCC